MGIGGSPKEVVMGPWWVECGGATLCNLCIRVSSSCACAACADSALRARASALRARASAAATRDWWRSVLEYTSRRCQEEGSAPWFGMARGSMAAAPLLVGGL